MHFYLCLYGIRHMVKRHLKNEGKPAAVTTRAIFFQLKAKDLLCAPSHIQPLLYTS